MSSEALREAKVWLEQLASADRELVRTSGLAAALLDEVARLEQERDEHAKRADENLDGGMVEYHRRVDAEAALAVAREREQRHTKALRRIAEAGTGIPDWRSMADCARAALEDEPAAATGTPAATLAEPEGIHGSAVTAEAAPPGSASAAADEPPECPVCGNETPEADLTYSGCPSCRAAADEPGETP